VASANDGTVSLTARMSGDQEVPAADPDGAGKAKVDINVDAAGANGAIVAPLFELVGIPNDPRNDALESGRLKDCVSADPAVSPIVASPAGYCVNVHHTRFPASAIRGQLEDWVRARG
jgi:hypothetical protein